MILLHAALAGPTLHVWGESDQELSPRALAAALDDAVSGLAAGGVSPERLAAWLPTAHRRPLPSSPLLETSPPVSPPTRAHLVPWPVSTLPLTPAQAVLLLGSAVGRDTLAPGLIVSMDLAFWTTALRFAGALALRQHFLPGIVEAGEGWRARWTPVLDGADAKRRVKLAKAMPGAAAVREWRRPVAAATDAPFRLCFRLEEPPPQEDGPRQPWSVRYLLQSRRDPSLLFPAEKAWQGRTAERLLGDPAVREHLLASLGQAAGVCPPVEESLHSPAPTGYATDAHGAHLFLTESAAALEQAGFGVLLPSWWTGKGTRLRLGVRAAVRSPKMKESGAGVGLEELVHVDWQVVLGEETLTLSELQALARMKEPLVRVRGQWVHMTAEEIRAAIEVWRRKEKTASARDLLRIALGAVTSLGPLPIEGVQATGWAGDVLARLEGHAGFQEQTPPAGLEATLRPYQQRGYSWLAFLRRWGLGACLADDMGLGKTVQTLALLLSTRNGQGPALVVCPTSVVGNWQREAERFTPGLRVLVHHGVGRGRGEAFREAARQHALVITSYSLLLRDFEHLSPVEWSTVVLDEAQNIKNPETKQAQSARALLTPNRIALTGTPV